MLETPSPPNATTADPDPMDPAAGLPPALLRGLDIGELANATLDSKPTPPANSGTHGG